MTDPLDREQFLKGYLAEAEDHLRLASASLLSIERAIRAGEPQAKLVRDLFRSLHTLKGLSAMVAAEPIVEIAHHMETIVRSADRAGARLSLDAIELLLKGVAAIEQRVRAVAERRTIPAPPEALIVALSGHRDDGGANGAHGPVPELALDPELKAKLAPAELEQIVQGATHGRRAVRVDFQPSAERSEQGITITSVREAVAKVGELVKVMPRTGPGGLSFVLILLTSAPDAAIAEAAHATPDRVTTVVAPARPAPAPALDTDPLDTDPLDASALRHGVIRVEVARLDDALEKLSALVVNRFRLVRATSELRDRGADVRELTAILAETSRQLRDLRGSIMRARMVSVSELLERVPLIVRGLGQATGKAVQLRIDAGRAELDKAVAERIFPAIVHLVRNAVDHALETPDERTQKGKRPEGTITVACFEHSDSQLELRVEDDGRGVDAAAVAQKAGVPVPATAAELLELMTRPGLTTRETASPTSGRGMGLDIVKRTVQALGGEMALHTAPGRGSTFTLRLPLSVSILDAFSFQCGGQSFVVPVAMVDEIVSLDRDAVFSSSSSGEGEVRLMERRGRFLPVLDLARLLELPAGTSAATKALVVSRAGEPYAIAVDRMLGQQEVVIRPVEDPLVRVPGITGTTDLGDGRPTLVLDLVALTGAPTLEEVRA